MDAGKAQGDGCSAEQVSGECQLLAAFSSSPLFIVLAKFSHDIFLRSVYAPIE